MFDFFLGRGGVKTAYTGNVPATSLFLMIVLLENLADGAECEGLWTMSFEY